MSKQQENVQQFQHEVTEMTAELLRSANAEVDRLRAENTQLTIKIGHYADALNGSLPKQYNNHLAELGWAWVLIANAHGGYLPTSEEWIEEAEKWRQRYQEIVEESLNE